MLEIYNETIKDLLGGSGGALELHQHKTLGFYVQVAPHPKTPFKVAAAPP